METKDGNEKIQDSEFDVRSRDCVWGTVSANGKNVTVSSQGAEAPH